MAPRRELAETILDSGDTLLTILGDILDFSKIDHNRMVLESAPVDLRQTIEATVEMVAAEAVKKGLEIAYRLHPELQQRRILGDAIRIRQVRPSPPLRCLLERFPDVAYRQRAEFHQRRIWATPSISARRGPSPSISHAGAFSWWCAQDAAALEHVGLVLLLRAPYRTDERGELGQLLTLLGARTWALAMLGKSQESVS